MTLVSPHSYKGGHVKITYSTGSNTTLVLGDTVSPPYPIKFSTVCALAHPCMDDVSTLINP